MNVVLTKQFQRFDRGFVLNPGGVIAEKLIKAGGAIPISKADEDKAERAFGGVPRIPEPHLDRMVRAYEKKRV